METEIVDGMEIVYGDEIEISATKHISLSSVAYDIQEFVGEYEGNRRYDRWNRVFTPTFPKLLEKKMHTSTEATIF